MKRSLVGYIEVLLGHPNYLAEYTNTWVSKKCSLNKTLLENLNLFNVYWSSINILLFYSIIFLGWLFPFL